MGLADVSAYTPTYAGSVSRSHGVRDPAHGLMRGGEAVGGAQLLSTTGVQSRGRSWGEAVCVCVGGGSGYHINRAPPTQTQIHTHTLH